MKNIFLALAVALLTSACSSGTTVADLPANVTGRYLGTFQNTPDTQSGTIALTIAEADGGVVTGNIIFESDGDNCLGNNVVTGTSTGFQLALTSPQEGEGEDAAGVLNMQFTISNSGNNLGGSYVVTGETCSDGTGSGLMTLRR